MYLKTLELQGFKSFPDKTVIEFDKGMTAVVGANGSGKSNISDAVRWVLGEMSAKSLRGDKMEDVIFNGSSGRKPAGFAEVIMTIDNSDFLMKIDFDEVSVGRKLYRTGESEYSLNHKPCRLKDIVELFLNTGIGREGYSVISQGKIAEVVSMKGTDRRELIEEAAGISSFRYRKTEAQRKLVSVTENALRINDVLSEVQGRIPRLEAQSEKARQYLEIAGEKKDLELGIWSRRFAEIQAQTAKFSAEEREGQQELDRISDEISAQDVRLEALYVEGQQKQIDSENLREEIAAAARRDAELASALSALETEIRHMDERREELKQSGEAREEEVRALGEAEKAAMEEFAALQAALTEAEEKEEDSRARTLEAAKKLAEASNEAAETENRRKALSERESEIRLALREEEGFGKARAERLEALKAELGKWAGKKEERESVMGRLSEEKDRAEKKVKALRTENGALNLDLYHLGEEIEEKGEAAGKARARLLAAVERRETLLRMERLLEGFSDSVKEVVNARELTGVCGPVSKLLSTEEEYVLAIETALGASVQNVVVETEEDAKAAIRFLKENRLGRATFLPLNTLRPQTYHAWHIRAEGYLGLASELCRVEDRYRVVADHLLGKTLVCRDIDSAASLARAEKYGVNIVTLDGQLIRAGGAFTGGQAQAKSGVLTRNADLARLNEEIGELEKTSGALEEELKKAEETRSEKRGALRENEEALAKAEAAFREAENTRYLEEESFRRNLQGLDSLEEEIASITAAQEKNGAENEKRRLELDRIAGELAGADSALAALEESRKEAEKERETIMLDAAVLAGKRAEAQMRLEAGAARLNEIRAHREELLSADARKEEILRDLALQRQNAVDQAQKDNAERQALSREGEEKRALQVRLAGEIAAGSEESERIRTEQKQKQQRKETLLATLSRAHSALSGMEREREAIRRSLFEEYELEPESEEFVKARSIDTDALGGQARLGELRARIRRVGPVNLESIEELKEAKERFDFLNEQYTDIVKSKDELESMIRDLESTMREMFSETFEKIRFAFKRIFRELFGGGDADIMLTDAEDLLSCGVDIKVQPPGKVIKHLSILSGGEQAFVAIALYMSLLEINPSPFCIFDEIESALDEANVRRYAQYLKKHNEMTQYIVITHRRGTMEEADTLYGITMQEKGVSDFIRLDAGSINRFAEENK